MPFVVLFAGDLGKCAVDSLRKSVFLVNLVSFVSVVLEFLLFVDVLMTGMQDYLGVCAFLVGCLCPELLTSMEWWSCNEHLYSLFSWNAAIC